MFLGCRSLKGGEGVCCCVVIHVAGDMSETIYHNPLKGRCSIMIWPADLTRPSNPMHSTLRSSQAAVDTGPYSLGRANCQHAAEASVIVIHLPPPRLRTQNTCTPADCYRPYLYRGLVPDVCRVWPPQNLQTCKPATLNTDTLQKPSDKPYPE